MAVLALFTFAAGCRDSASDSQADFADRQHREAVEAANRALAASNDDDLADFSDDDDLDSSGIKSFANKLAEQFNQDRQAAFEELVYWEGISDADRQLNMEMFLSNETFNDGMDGKVRGNPSSQMFEEYKSYVKYLQLPDSEFVTKPTHLVLLHIVNEDENITQVWYPVVEVDGRFYVCPAKTNS